MASEVYNIIREFDHCAQRGLNHIYKIIGLYNDYPLLQKSQRGLNDIYKIIELHNDYLLLQKSLRKTFNREELNNKFKNILNGINQNEKNIIIDNENFIYVDKNAKPLEEGEIDPKQIKLFQLIQYCGNKIFKEEVNTFSRIINACKNDNDHNYFQQILKNNMLIGCKRIKSIMCALREFLKSEILKSYKDTSSKDLQNVYQSINKEIETLKSVIQQIDEFITQYRLEDKLEKDF